MRFHGLKMKEINDTIADLWTKTYQGTGSSFSLVSFPFPRTNCPRLADIDKIMIKSDAEGKTSGTARSYNYRVRLFLPPLFPLD